MGAPHVCAMYPMPAADLPLVPFSVTGSRPSSQAPNVSRCAAMNFSVATVFLLDYFRYNDQFCSNFGMGLKNAGRTIALGSCCLLVQGVSPAQRLGGMVESPSVSARRFFEGHADKTRAERPDTRLCETEKAAEGPPFFVSTFHNLRLRRSFPLDSSGSENSR